MNDLEQARKDPKFIASAILVALIVVGGLVLAGIYALGGNDKDSANPRSGSTAGVSSSSCGLADGDQTVPTTAPTATWALAGSTATPTTKRYGPGKTDAALHSCFARNPTGAVFAAINYYADAVNPKVSRERLIAERIFSDDNSDKASTGEAPTATPIYQVAGFRVEDATPDRVTVAVVVRATDGPTAGQQAAVTFTLGWQDGDWRMVVPPGGQPPTTAIASLSGYVAWSGV